MSREALRVAVIGVGDMGSNHARIYESIKGAELVAVVDPHAEKAATAGARYGCAALTSIDHLSNDVEAVSICAPSSLHAELAIPLLERGLHCLIEKPLAPTKEECLAVIDAARGSGAALLVGHVERFNPAVDQLRTILQLGERIHAVDARRMSAVSARIKDVDVVADLMIHDIHLVLDLVGKPVVDVVARGVTRSRDAGADYATALVTFEGDLLASLTASRVTQNQVRELQVTTEQRFFTLDYIAQELHIYRQGRIGPIGEESPNHGLYILDVNTERVFVRRSEPLVRELQHFVEVARGATQPIVSGDDGLRALQIAWRIQEEVRTHTWC